MKGFSCILILFAFFFSFCNQQEAKEGSDPAEKLYSQLCKNCHGSKGDLGFSQAPNLIKSELEKEQVIDIISNGKGLMQAYGAVIKEDDIAALADYVISLRSKDQ